MAMDLSMTFRNRRVPITPVFLGTFASADQDKYLMTFSELNGFVLLLLLRGLRRNQNTPRPSEHRYGMED